MSARDELIGRLKVALAEIQQRDSYSSNASLDSELLGVVADYIEQGMERETALQRLRGALLRSEAALGGGFAPAVEEGGDEGPREAASLGVSAEEMGRRRAERLLAQALTLRFR
ncbi:hypothetical protein C3747_25g462c [Trypanosoma cruzi]|uniref:Uncharacterized protein n=2 Tax=Trypanosoma cruzi TaxID=5693 RepID=Q4DT23_TRYCC|nr:hypothetical protein, conserved [Trypanosoma cruzi]EAN95659.1 hypothetical protein, conserved [Trypanosoma cruzi]KAF8295966.1 hypothetical protein TcYC6_0088300 [Trypanosoma cruzi]PWV16118.1 hypothetical protein C3747_25g462c [Trypanosoma cruzi]RNC57842.1 hypothetical protein TcCL_ESM04581 [Trypanosoma cruzi]|eukprot:XP_817510.1 hypothetical protein [Trypanosoma cruzi strain CL Brener]